MNTEQIHNLLYEALETEMGGIEIYRTALRCVAHEELRKEWEEYLEQTENHERILRSVFEEARLDPQAETPGRKVVRHIGHALVKAMEMALEAGDASAAQIVAAECVIEAETKDHLNWELLGMVGKKLKEPLGEALTRAYGEVEDQEDEHLYHTTGWGRELWIQSLGMPAVLPPPEEAKAVKTAIGAARAKKARRVMKKAS